MKERVLVKFISDTGAVTHIDIDHIIVVSAVGEGSAITLSVGDTVYVGQGVEEVLTTMQDAIALMHYRDDEP